MDSSCTSAIPRHMKMTPQERCERVWVSSLQWKTCISVCNKTKASNLVSVSAFIPGWWLLVRWAKQDVRNSSHWVKRQTLPPEFKDSPPRILQLSVKRHYVWCRDILPVKP